MQNSSRNLSRSVYRAATILNSINEGNVGVTDISNNLNLDKATVYRILKALENTGLVTQSLKNKKYYLGPLISKLSSNALVGHQMLINCALDEMIRLRDKYEETLCLQIPTGMSGTYIEVTESRHSIRHTIDVGSSLPLNIGSGGKALLSQFSTNDLEIFFRCGKLKNLGIYTITNENELRERINQIKEVGYITSHAEVSKGGVGIAVPIYHYVCPASLSIIFPADRCDEVKMTEMIKSLKESSSMISNRLIQLTDLMPKSSCNGR